MSGSFCLAWVKVDCWENPNLEIVADYAILRTEDSKIIAIPSGFANGIKALEANSKIIIYSDMSLEHSVNEKIRYPKHYWLDWNSI